MTLPIQPSRIKAKAARAPLAPYLLVLCLVGTGGLTACRAQVAQAPFPVRPDTVVVGDLRGPFDGRIVDGASGNPVSAALVIGTWAYRSRGGGDNATPAFSQTATTLSGPDGTYSISRTTLPSSPTSVLRGFTLVVYKAGYAGYRSDLRFEDSWPRHDFAQRQNRVSLARFPEGRSHAAHLAFLGGGAPLRQASLAEHVQAALDLAEAQPQKVVSPPKKEAKDLPPLPQAVILLPASEVSALAAQARVRGLTHVPGPLVDNITGQAQGASYESVHYRATGKAESFDVALRVWRPGDPQATAALFEQIAKNLSAFLSPADKNKEGAKGEARTLFAYDPRRRIHGQVVFLEDRDPPLIVQITCGASLCPKKEGASKLLQQVLGRLPK